MYVRYTTDNARLKLKVNNVILVKMYVRYTSDNASLGTYFLARISILGRHINHKKFFYNNLFPPSSFPNRWPQGHSNNIREAGSLQIDFNHLQVGKMGKDWQMVFNTDQCEHIRTTNK